LKLIRVWEECAKQGQSGIERSNVSEKQRAACDKKAWLSGGMGGGGRDREGEG